MSDYHDHHDDPGGPLFASLKGHDRHAIIAALDACRFRYCESTRESVAADILATRARAPRRLPANVWPDTFTHTTTTGGTR